MLWNVSLFLTCQCHFYSLGLRQGVFLSCPRVICSHQRYHGYVELNAQPKQYLRVFTRRLVFIPTTSGAAANIPVSKQSYFPPLDLPDFLYSNSTALHTPSRCPIQPWIPSLLRSLLGFLPTRAQMPVRQAAPFASSAERSKMLVFLRA